VNKDFRSQIPGSVEDTFMTSYLWSFLER